MMGEETLGFSAMDDPVMMPSSLEDFEMDLENLPRENQQQRRSMAAAAATFSRERELNIIRSGSAPPTVEGARTAIGSLFGDPDFAGINLTDFYDQRSLLSEENIRSRQSYSRYYGSNEESRIALPAALSKEDWLIARRFQSGASTLGGIGDRRSALGRGTGSESNGLLFSPQPGLPPRAMGLEHANMRAELRSFYCQSPSDWRELEDDDLIAPPAMGSNARQSFADALQMEHARNSSNAIHHQSHLMGLGPFGNTIDHGVADPRLLKMRTIPPSLIRAQSFNSSASDSFTSVIRPPVIPRSITPDSHHFSNSSSLSPNLARRGGISPNGYPRDTSDRLDLAAALSAMKLSTNRVENEGNFNFPRQQNFEEYSNDFSDYLHLKNMNNSEVDSLNLLSTHNGIAGSSVNADFSLSHGSSYPLNQRIPNSVNTLMDTGGRNYIDPLLLQYLQGNDASALNKNLLALQMRFSRIPSRRSLVGPTGSWDLDNSPAIGGFGSSLLEEFKSNKTRNFELAEIVGHVVEFSADQHGSRFIQQKLEVASDEEKNRIFLEIIPHARALMTDVFGNYVIQKFFEHGTERQRKQLASQLIGHVLQLSLQMYGCRVIQKALEVVDVDQQSQMVSELDGSIMKCIRDQNGNHVIQKCIECVPQEKIHFIVSAFYGQVIPLSTHPYGCRVIQRVLEHCDDPKTQSIMMEEILQAVSVLTQDQYGNYVIQHVLQHGRPEERAAIIGKLAGQIVKMSQQKFASNVIEKCLTFGNREERQLLINEILGPNDENEPLQAMMKDQFGNYVVQKVLETCDDKNRELILSRIKAHVGSLKKYTYGKHIAARVEKVIAAGERRMLMSSNAS